jgi:Fe-S cluster assembly protein SufB
LGQGWQKTIELNNLILQELEPTRSPNIPREIHKRRETRDSMSATTVKTLVNQPYKYGFVTDIESDTIPKGLSEDVIRLISAKKDEPEFMLEFRLKAYRQWLKMTEPKWAHVGYPAIDYQDIIYYSAPKQKKEKKQSLDEVDPTLLETFEKLGIPISEQKRLSNVAVDAIFDSVSIATTFKEKLAEAGVIFCSISEALQEHPDLIQKYLGSVVPVQDNFFSALNAAVFSDGSFVFIPKGVKCPMELSTYFRINNGDTGQFERTLIVAEEGASVSYLEGCTAPMYDTNQLHAAVVELVALDNAEIKYSTVQNWYAGDANGKGGIYNFVTKRGLCKGVNSKISWTQVETGSAITWKYPSCVLVGDNSVGEFYSIALTNNMQQADTGTKMVHIGKNTRSTIISKGISAGSSKGSYRGLVKIGAKAKGARNYSQCDSMLIGDNAEANTFPYIQVDNNTARVEHEASTSKIGEDQLFYFAQRGISEEDAISMLVSGFCKDVLNELPMEFAAEADKLLSLKLEGTVG